MLLYRARLCSRRKRKRKEKRREETKEESGQKSLVGVPVVVVTLMGIC
jgi:hypothetical protein